MDTSSSSVVDQRFAQAPHWTLSFPRAEAVSRSFVRSFEKRLRGIRSMPYAVRRFEETKQTRSLDSRNLQLRGRTSRQHRAWYGGPLARIYRVDEGAGAGEG